MNQNLSGYKIFYEVATCGNISKAAKKLYISQPAISKSIVKLEDGLDTKLFKRNSRGVTLTDEGQVLFNYVKDAFDSINSAEEELKQMKDYNIGHIQIGASTTLCRSVLIPYLEKFMKLYPNIRVSITTQDSAKTMNLLDQKKLDIGLVGEPKSKRPELKFVHSQVIHDVFVATPQYIENLRSLFGSEYSFFQNANIMLLDENNLTRRHIDDYFKTINVEPQQIFEVNSMDLLIEYARIGIGAACVIRELVQDRLNDGTLIEIPMNPPIPTRSIGFVYSQSNMSKSLNAFLSILD